MIIEQKSEANEFPPDVIDIVHTDPFLNSLKGVGSVLPITGGVAHRVFQISHDENTYFLKIRGDHFARIPSITCDPTDIDHEYTALQKLGDVIPKIVPQIHSFSQEQHYLVLSDVIGQGEKMDLALTRENRQSGLFQRYGQTLRHIHDQTVNITEPIRKDGDDQYYQTVLGHRFGYRNHPALLKLTQELSSLPGRRLILGDFAPKNIGVPKEEGLLTLFDLETAHQGNVEFDYGYAVAHVILHSAPNKKQMAEAVTAFQNGYGPTSFDQALITKITQGILLYRLHSIIPYQTKLTFEETQSMEKELIKALEESELSKDWISIGLN